MKSIQLTISVECALVFVLVASASASAAERKHFRADLQTTSQFVPIELVDSARCADEAGRPAVLGLLTVIGAGNASVLGTVVDEQSHCVRADFSFFNGRFLLTNADGHTISGRYFGQLVPTVNSTFPQNAPPGGPWLVLGNVCIDGGTAAAIDNDCRGGLYQSARGITNLNTGDATVFLDQTIGIHRR